MYNKKETIKTSKIDAKRIGALKCIDILFEDRKPLKNELKTIIETIK